MSYKQNNSQEPSAFDQFSKFASVETIYDISPVMSDNIESPRCGIKRNMTPTIQNNINTMRSPRGYFQQSIAQQSPLLENFTYQDPNIQQYEVYKTDNSVNWMQTVLLLILLAIVLYGIYWLIISRKKHTNTYTTRGAVFVTDLYGIKKWQN